MTISDLIAELEELRDEVGGDAPVTIERVAHVFEDLAIWTDLAMRQGAGWRLARDAEHGTATLVVVLG